MEHEKNAFFSDFKVNLQSRYGSDPFQSNRKVVEQVRGYRSVPVGFKLDGNYGSYQSFCQGTFDADNKQLVMIVWRNVGYIPPMIALLDNATISIE